MGIVKPLPDITMYCCRVLVFISDIDKPFDEEQWIYSKLARNV